MSHVATCEVKITDLDALREACKQLGLVFQEGQKTYHWYGHWVNDYHGADAAYQHGFKPEDYGKCEHAISVAGQPGAYEAGLVKAVDGNGWSLIWDFYGHQGKALTKILGKDATTLANHYGAQVAAKMMRAKGFASQLTFHANGEVELKCVQ